MREYASPASGGLPESGNLSDDIVVNAQQHPDAVAFRRRTAEGWLAVTTTEFLSRYIFDQMAAAVRDGRLGEHAGGIDRLRVTLNESHIAKAWYEATIAG